MEKNKDYNVKISPLIPDNSLRFFVGVWLWVFCLFSCFVLLVLCVCVCDGFGEEKAEILSNHFSLLSLPC